jgi:S1-C subfamily serine protease
MFEAVFEQCWRSIYAVFAESCFGTAFAVGTDGYIATALHVVTAIRGGAVVLMQTVMGAPPQNRPTFTARLVAASPRTDLALLQVEPVHSVVPLQLSPLPAAYGASALVLGYPATYRDERTARAGKLMVNLRVNGCVVASDMSLPPLDGTTGPPVEIFELDAHLHPGMSGAPVVNTKAEVIGVVSRGFLRNRPNLGLAETSYSVAVRAEHLHALVQTLPPH